MTFNNDVNDKFGTIYKIWFDMLITEKILEIAPETTNEVIESLFIRDQIDPIQFISNYNALETASEFTTITHDEFTNPTQSLTDLVESMKSPEHIPIWFIAAYPDVVMWYKNKQNDYIKVNGKEGLVDFNIGIFKTGLSPNQKLTDSENNHSPELLRNLVDSYKEELELKLETSS